MKKVNLDSTTDKSLLQDKINDHFNHPVPSVLFHDYGMTTISEMITLPDGVFHIRNFGIKSFEKLNKFRELAALELMWAVFIVHYGEKMYVTKIDDHKKIHEFARVRFKAPSVLKFRTKAEAIEVIRKQGDRFKTYGLTASNGYNEQVSKRSLK